MTTLVLDATNIREGFTTVTPYVRVRGSRTPRLPHGGLRREGDVQHRGGAGGVHREVLVGDSMLMIGEGGAEGGLPFSPAAFHVYVPDADAAFQRALAAGGTSMGDPEDRPYGERAGFIKDAFGNHWYIATAFGASYVPEGRRTITPFVHPSGVPAYIDFLKRALGAEEEFRHEVEGVVMHARLLIGNSAIEMGDTQGASEPMRTGFSLRRRRRCAVCTGGGGRRDAAFAPVRSVLRRPHGQRRGRAGHHVVYRAAVRLWVVFGL